MPWALLAVQWAHIAFGILWVGGAAALEVVVGPAAAALPPAHRRAFGRRLGERVGPCFAVIGAGTMLLGVVRGTLLGPIRGVAALGTPYGLTWLVALLLTAGVAAWGGAVLGPVTARLYASDALWAPDPAGGALAALVAAERRLGALGAVQLAGFALILACMVLMAAGL